MEEILEHKKNPLLKREEIKILMFSEKNPSYAEAGKFVSEKFKKSEDDIAIKRVKGKFGRKSFLVEANIYHSKEDKEAIEPKKKVKKEAAK